MNALIALIGLLAGLTVIWYVLARRRFGIDKPLAMMCSTLVEHGTTSALDRVTSQAAFTRVFQMAEPRRLQNVHVEWDANQEQAIVNDIWDLNSAVIQEHYGKCMIDLFRRHDLITEWHFGQQSSTDFCQLTLFCTDDSFVGFALSEVPRHQPAMGYKASAFEMGRTVCKKYIGPPRSVTPVELRSESNTHHAAVLIPRFGCVSLIAFCSSEVGGGGSAGE